jgi:hypothetical protein
MESNMASIKTVKKDELWVVSGRFREIFIRPVSQGSGEGYRLFQIANIDDSGHQKVREWGWAATSVDATEKAAGHAERQNG